MRYYKVIDLPKDLNNLSAEDINTIAKIVANANIAYWDAIGWSEDLNKILKNTNDDETMRKIAKAFKRLKNNMYSSLIEPELYGAETQDVNQYFSELNELIEEE
jgi:hypothetical protein